MPDDAENDKETDDIHINNYDHYNDDDKCNKSQEAKFQSSSGCASCRPEQITIDNSTTEFTIPFASDIISVDDTTGCKIRTFTCTGITLNVVIISVNFDDYTQGDITSTSVSFQCNADGVWQYTVDPNEPLLSTFIVNSVLCEDVGP
ncbi:unnamed protein product, partial [Mesorhabditis spiculigera]